MPTPLRPISSQLIPLCLATLLVAGAASLRPARAAETRTFQLGEPPEPVAVRAAGLDLDAEGGLARGVLARPQEVAGVPLPAGAVVVAAPGGAVRYVESPTPVEAWGVRLAPGHPIYVGSVPGGTLAGDAIIGGLRLRGGTTVALEFGHAPPRWEPAVVRGTLAVATALGGVTLPAGTVLVRDCQQQFDGDHDLIHATLPSPRRVHGVAVSPAGSLAIHADGRFTATLGAPLRSASGVALAAGARASFYADGALLRARPAAPIEVTGLRVVAGEELELWPSGRLKRAVLAPGSFGQPGRAPVVAGFADADGGPTYAFVVAPPTRAACPAAAAGRIAGFLPSGAPLVRVTCGDAERLHRELAATLAIGGVAGTHWPAGTEVAWEDHPEAGPVIALTSPREHTVHGVRAAAHHALRLDREGRLVECISAADQVIDGVRVGAGERLALRYDDRTGARRLAPAP